MQKRSVVNSHGLIKLKQKRYKILKTKITTYSVIFLILLVGISLASKINKLNINEMKISGNVVVDSKTIETIVNDDLKGHYFWIFPKTNFLIYPKAKIINDLSTKYKRLKNISLNVINFRTLEITVNEYEGKYLYCGNVTPLLDSRSEQKCYFMDSKGYIFDEAPYFSGELYFKFYGVVSGGQENPTGSYFSANIFSKLITFKESIEKMDLKPLYIWINNQNEVYVNLSTLGIAPLSPSIIFRVDANYEKMAENLKAAITTEPLLSKLKNNYKSLNYIDLRFGNKVYYKFK